MRGVVVLSLFATAVSWSPGLAQAVADAPARTDGAALPVLATIDVGLDPHQIAFSATGDRAFVAAAGSNQIAVLDVPAYRVRWRLPAAGTPLGVAVLDGGSALAVSRFAGSSVGRMGARVGAPLGDLDVGGGPSLLVGPLPDGRLLVSVERADRLVAVDGTGSRIVGAAPAGVRPFPPAVTADGRAALVPGYESGTLTRVDLASFEIAWTVEVGQRPSGGAVLPGDSLYAGAVRGDDRLVLVDVRTGSIRGYVEEGIGRGPFSVVTSPALSVAFVNNTASHDISVLDLATLRVIHRVPVPEIPIVMAIHPDGRSLWVSSEGHDALTVLGIPAAMSVQAAPAGPSGTDIWTAELVVRDGWVELGGIRRVTDRRGYDNQPHFLPDGRLLYTSIDESGQADIWQIDAVSGVPSPFTRTAPESEYSAALMPGGDRVSVTRVEADSTQRLWSFDLSGSDPRIVVEGVEPVGYTAWIDADRLAAFVLGDPPTLQLVDVPVGTTREIASAIGRSLHSIPNRWAISFVQFSEDGTGTIRAVDVASGILTSLTPTRPGSQDFAWTPNGTLLMGQGSVLYQWTTAGGWRQVADLADVGIEGITRLAVSPDGARVAIVGER